MFKAIISKFFKKTSLKPVREESIYTPSNATGSFGYFADNGKVLIPENCYYDEPKGFYAYA